MSERLNVCIDGGCGTCYRCQAAIFDAEARRLRGELQCLLQAVVVMRRAQCEYFKYKSDEWLKKAKQAERELERIVFRMTSPTPELLLGR